MARNTQPKLKIAGIASDSGITNFAQRTSDYHLELTPIPESFARMQYFLREIGQGPKGKRDLTREEAREEYGTGAQTLGRPGQQVQDNEMAGIGRIK